MNLDLFKYTNFFCSIIMSLFWKAAIVLFFTTLGVIGAHYIYNLKSIYHTMTTSTTPNSIIYCSSYMLNIKRYIYNFIVLWKFSNAIKTLYIVNLSQVLRDIILNHLMSREKPINWKKRTMAAFQKRDIIIEQKKYVIKFVSDLQQVGCFLRELWIPQPIKRTATI
jgi:hypothetical protein